MRRRLREVRLQDGEPTKAMLGDALLKKCISIDLEIDPKTNRIQSFAGLRKAPEGSYVFKQGNVFDALNGLDRLADTAELVVPTL